MSISLLSLPKSPSKCPSFYRIVSAKDGGICRIRLELGELSFHQMNTIATVAEQYGNGLIELTTRANIQIRGILKKNREKVIEALTSAKLGPLQKSGDDIRNIMINPTAGFDQRGSLYAWNFAKNLLRKLQLSPKSSTLSPKFSFYIDSGEQCAVTDHIHDVWFYITEDEKSLIFGLASCPPLEENSLSASLAMVGLEQAFESINALLDCFYNARRKNPTIQRMKHLRASLGYEKIFDCLQQQIPDIIPAPKFWRNSFPTRLDLGIHATRFIGHYYLGIKPPLGRLSWQLMRDIARVAQKTLSTHCLRLTPWQGMIFPSCSLSQAKRLSDFFEKMMMICNSDNPYASILCCTGLKGCHSALSDVQADAHRLIKTTIGEKKIFQQMIHLPACSKSCTATTMYPVTLLAVKNGFYDIYHQKEGEKGKFGKRVAQNVALDKVAILLKQQTSGKKYTMSDYNRDSVYIYKKSFAIIRKEACLDNIPNDLEKVAVRIIHSCGMVDLVKDLAFSSRAGVVGRQALLCGAPILCDSHMLAKGVTRRRLPKQNQILCTLEDPTVPELAKKFQTTRSAAAVELWKGKLAGSVIAIGNAPTALFRVLEMIRKGAGIPALILAFPVGFVGATESKEELIFQTPPVSYITLRGRRGGSAMAAAAVNALASEEE